MNTIKKELQNKLPNRKIEVDDTTYPEAIIIAIDGVWFPPFPQPKNFDVLWATLQTYCDQSIYKQLLTYNDEHALDRVIKQVTSFDNTETYVDDHDLKELASELECYIDNQLYAKLHNKNHCSLAQLTLLQKIADESGFDNAAETMGLAKNKMLGYALHFKHCYWAVADSLTTEIQKYESADVYDYLNASSQDLGELIKDAAKEYLEWSNQ